MALPDRSGKTGTRLRPLESSEQYFLFMDKNRSTHFSMIAEVSGKRSVEQWQQGLNSLGNIHPLLSASIVEPEGEAPYFAQGDSVIPLRHIETEDAGAWEQELAAEFAVPFDTAHAPLARAVLLSGKEKSTLIFTIHHSIGDAYSVMYVLRDLLSILTGDAPPHQSLREMSTRERLAFIAGTPEPLDPPIPSSRPGQYRTNDHALPSVSKLELSVPFTDSLLARTREENTTVHAVLSAALALAGAASHSAWSEHGVRLFSPISIRKQLWQDERCELSLVPGLIDFAVGSDATLWVNARKAGELLAPQRTFAGVNAKLNGLSYLLGLGLSPAALGDASSQGMTYDLMVSNPGKVLIGTSFGDLKLEKLWGPGYLGGWEDEHVVGVTTMNGILRLLYVSHSPIPELLSDAKARLEEAIGEINGL